MKRILKIAALLSAAGLLFSCGEKMEGGKGTGESLEVSPLQLSVDKDVIQSNGSDVATFKVIFEGKDVTSEAVICDDSFNELGKSTFTTSQDGEYRFYATYGTASTYNNKADDKGLLTVKAISVPVPSVATDPQPNNTSFVNRAFLTQFTGTGCGNCPGMVDILRELKKDNTITDDAVLAAIHTYNSSDPAYLDKYSATPNSYPFLQVDMVNGFFVSNGEGTLREHISNSVSDGAKAGVSVNPVYYPDSRDLVIRVSVKAAVDGIFNVGAWLLEDGIVGQQTGAPDSSYDTHDNCVRITDSKYYTTYFGYPLGELEAGETAEKTFVMYVKKKFIVENLHLAVFVSYGTPQTGKIAYTVCNVVDCPIDEPTPFEYK